MEPIKATPCSWRAGDKGRHWEMTIIATQVKDDNSMDSSDSSRGGDIFCGSSECSRENKGVKNDVIVWNLTSQVNGGAIAEPKNAEGRD